MTVMADRAGAQLTITEETIDRCPPEEYSEFAADLAIIKTFIVAEGGWCNELAMRMARALRIDVAGSPVHVDNMVELVRDFNAKWSK